MKAMLVIKEFSPTLYYSMSVVGAVLFIPAVLVGFMAGALWSGFVLGFNLGEDQ